MRSLGGHTPGLYDWVLSATYSPDGQYIVTAYDTPSEARIWDATTGQELSQLRRHAAAVNEAVYSPDGQFIVTASDDTTARVWNASTGEEMRTPGTNAERINSVAYSPDGQFIVTANADGTARIWNTRTSTEMRTPGDLVPEITSAAYSPDGRFIITARVDGTARIWDTITSETVHTLDARTDSVHSVAYSPNGKQIVTVGCSRKDDETGLCREASARLWDASTGLEVGQFTGRISEYSSATFSPDGKFVVTKDNDLNTVSFWHVPTTQKLYSLMVGKFLAYSPDSMRIVTADGAGTFYILDARTGAFVHEMSGHTATISSAAYSPNGRQIVTTSQDGTVRIWDSRRGQEVRRLNGHVDSVWSAIYSPDGKQIVTSGCDNRSTLGRCTAANIRIWDVATGREIRQLPGGTFGVGAYSPDGQFVITKGDDGMVRVWIADIDDLLAEAARLIQRDPPLLTPEERRQYGLEMQR